MENLSTILKPLYTTRQANESIPLPYKDTTELVQAIMEQEVKDRLQKSEVIESGMCEFEFRWFPYPSIYFKFENSNASFAICPTQDFQLRISNSIRSQTLNIAINNLELYGPNNRVNGRVKGPITHGEDQNLSYLIFHVVNFCGFCCGPTSNRETSIQNNRIVLETEAWKITIDQNKNTSELEQELKSQGGFAITHAGKLERLDREPFLASESSSILEALSDFLSFVRGSRVPLVFLVGYDKNDNSTWEKWTQPVGDSWQNISSWFPARKASVLPDIFQKFIIAWESEKEELKLSIYWYTVINITPSTETAIVLAQIALEKIAYVEGSKGKASKKIRSLLKKYKVPIIFPSQDMEEESEIASNSFQQALDTFKPPCPPVLQALEAASSSCDWEDGPHALIEIRNDIAHARQDYPDLDPQVFFDACDLALWYLELVMLARLGYQGLYTNRLRNKTEAVPWS